MFDHSNISEIERILRISMLFMETSRDFEQSRVDALLEEEHDPVFVYDPNLLKILINTEDSTSQSSSFNSSDWLTLSDIADPSAAHTWRQLSGITIENLLFNQKSQPLGLVFSSSHYSELIHNTANRGSEIEKRIGTLSEHTFRNLVSRKQRKLPAVGETDSLAGAHSQSEFAAALNKSVRRLVTGADDIDQAIQVRRILSPEFRSRVTILEDLIHDRDAQGVVERGIVRWAGDWYQALVFECRTKGIKLLDSDRAHDHEDRPSSPRRIKGELLRTSGGLWADAQTLAMIEYLNLHPRRIVAKDNLPFFVFVTNDNILFDAYRRSLANGKVGERVVSPLNRSIRFVRRFSQYSRSYFMHTGDKDESQASIDLRSQLLRVSEFSALPVSLLAPSTDYTSFQYEDLRDRRAIRFNEHMYRGSLLENDASFDRLNEIISTDVKTDTNYFDNFRKLINNWRKLEEAYVYYSDGHLENRLEEYKKALDLFPKSIVGDDLGWEQAAARIKRDIRKEAVKSFRPLADHTIESFEAKKWYSDPQRKAQTRIPVLLRTGEDLNDSFDGLLSVPSKIRRRLGETRIGEFEFTQRFIAASYICLFQSRWSDAGRFARLALRSIEGLDGFVNPEMYYEVMYLNALCSRFRLQPLIPSLKRESRAELDRIGKRALDRLSHCISYHSGRAQVGRQSMRLTRGLAERGTLQLTLALDRSRKFRQFVIEEEDIRYFDEAPGSIEGTSVIAKDFNELFAAAGRDFFSAWKLIKTADRSELPADLDRIYSTIEFQVAANLAAFFLIDRVHHSVEPISTHIEELYPDSRSMIESLISYWRLEKNFSNLGLSEVSELEVRLFLHEFSGITDEEIDFEHIHAGRNFDFDDRYSRFLIYYNG